MRQGDVLSFSHGTSMAAFRTLINIQLCHMLLDWESGVAAVAFDGKILSGVSVLAAVIEGGSFVKAAELIGITDSGVSRAIGRLETRLGARLLDRTTRSVSLTDEGRRFYEEVKPHLNAIEDAAVIASGAVSAVHGRLRIDI